MCPGLSRGVLGDPSAESSKAASRKLEIDASVPCFESQGHRLRHALYHDIDEKRSGPISPRAIKQNRAGMITGPYLHEYFCDLRGCPGAGVWKRDEATPPRVSGQ